MDTARQRWRATAAACLTVVVVSSCGSGSSGAPTAQGPASPPVAAQTPLTQAAPPDANDRACAGVEGVIAHIRADTARWSPNLRPFDRGIAVRLASQTRYLDSQALSAGPRVRRAVAATATAFGGVAEAIMARNRARLDHAVAQSRTAYSGLRMICKIGG